MCFLWISEQTAIISLYNINWLVFITERECVYCAVRTGSLNIIQVMSFLWISEQTAIISLYNINWMVFITEMGCVYCAVWTECLCVLCGSQNKQPLFPYTTLTGFYNRDGVCLLHGTDWTFMCFVWISEQTAIISLYNINWLVFITEVECVYCAVRTERLIHTTCRLYSVNHHTQLASVHCTDVNSCNRTINLK